MLCQHHLLSPTQSNFTARNTNMVSKSEFLYARSTASEYHSRSAVIRDGGQDADVDVWLVYSCILEQLVPGHRFLFFFVATPALSESLLGFITFLVFIIA